MTDTTDESAENDRFKAGIWAARAAAAALTLLVIWGESASGISLAIANALRSEMQRGDSIAWIVVMVVIAYILGLILSLLFYWSKSTLRILISGAIMGVICSPIVGMISQEMTLHK